MKMRPLIIDGRVMKEIARVKAHAEVHRQSVHDLMAVLGGRRGPVGDDPGFRTIIPVGFRVVYSQEQQPTHGLCHHLSVSVMNPIDPDRTWPHEVAVLEIAKAFGLPISSIPFPNGNVMLDEDNKAVNLIVPVLSSSPQSSPLTKE